VVAVALLWHTAAGGKTRCLSACWNVHSNEEAQHQAVAVTHRASDSQCSQQRLAAVQEQHGRSSVDQECGAMASMKSPTRANVTTNCRSLSVKGGWFGGASWSAVLDTLQHPNKAETRAAEWTRQTSCRINTTISVNKRARRTCCRQAAAAWRPLCSPKSRWPPGTGGRGPASGPWPCLHLHQPETAQTPFADVTARRPGHFQHLARGACFK
jgi:hypothetical protein